MVQKPSVLIMPTKKRSASINVKQMNAGIVIEKKIVLLTSAILLLFLFGTIGFSLAKQVSLFQGFINTVETLTFMHDKETELSPNKNNNKMALIRRTIFFSITIPAFICFT